MDIVTKRFFLMLLAIVAVILIIFYIVEVFIPAMGARKNIVREMERSGGSEYRYWKRQLRMMYISLIPFVGALLAMQYRKHYKKKHSKNKQKK